MNKDLNSNMVENFKIEPKNVEIDAENIIQDLKRLENLSFFTSMDDFQKVEYVISRASYDLIDWHCALSQSLRKSSKYYSKWKENILDTFSKEKIILGDLYRKSRKKSKDS